MPIKKQWAKASAIKQVICTDCNATSVRELGTPGGAKAFRAHLASDKHARKMGW